MKILLVHNFYQHRGGEEVSVELLSKILTDNGHKIIPFYYDSNDIRKFNFVDKFLIPFRLLYSKTTKNKVEQLIFKEKPDIAHIHNLFPLITPWILYTLKKYNIPVVMTLHNYRLLCLNGLFLKNDGEICESCKNGNFVCGILNKCYHNSYFQSTGVAMPLWFHRKMWTFVKNIDVFIAPSKFLRQKYIASAFPQENIITIPHFIDLENYKTDIQFDNYAIFIGRLSQEKGVLTIVKAFKDIAGIKLKILGEGPFKKELQNFVTNNKIDNIEFLGFVNGKEKVDLLKKAMFLIFPSECYENMPYTILESFACGVPVVASKIGGVVELVEEGITGFLFEAKNVSDLKGKIIKLVSDKELLLRMRNNVRKVAEEKYCKEVGYRNIISVYQKLTEAIKQ
jgi:glycosyltransferase involved in cell wall biosynthesis